MGTALNRDLTRALPYVGIAGVYFVFFAALILFGLSPVLDGNLSGPDSYMHLVRAIQLFDTGAWFDSTIPRANAPFGDVLNWTRPFDVLLLAGAAVFSPVLGFKAGMFWAGALSAPVLLALTALVLAWATKPFLGRGLRFLAMVMILAQPALMTYSFPGHADHHNLVFLAFIVVLGFMVRLMQNPYDRDLALTVGAVLGVGVWFSVEFLLILAVAFATMSLNWIVIGGDCARKNLGLALGLTTMVAAALLFERPPAQYLAEEYDRISVVHLLIALVASGFWGVVGLLEQRGRGPKHIPGRCTIAAFGMVAATIIIFAVFPKFFGGPMVDVDPQFIKIWTEAVGEMRPLVPVNARETGRFLFYLGPALVCVPFLMWLLISGRAGPHWWAWLYLGLCLALYLPLALLHFRFAPFAELLLVVVLVELVGRFRQWFQWRCGRFSGQLARALICTGLLIGGIGLGMLVTVVAGLTKTAAVAREPTSEMVRCPLPRMAAYLESARWRGHPRIILATISYGAELLYRTRHKVVGTPNHRNLAGIVDVHRFFTAVDTQQSRRVVQRRGVDLVLLCPNQGDMDLYHLSKGDDAFYLRLWEGRVPPWLRAVELPPQMGGFRLFEVIR